MFWYFVTVLELASMALVYGKAVPDLITNTNVELRMPNVQPKLPDICLCHSIKMNTTATYINFVLHNPKVSMAIDQLVPLGSTCAALAIVERYIKQGRFFGSVGFIPRATMETAHHMVLYGCKVPGESKAVWDCGEKESRENTGQYELAPACKSGSKKLYGWAMNAESLHLPNGVGFEVGGDSDVDYLVLEVHYDDVDKFLPPKSETDNSGITLVTTETPMPKRAGVYLLGAMGTIPQQSTVYMEAACSFDDEVIIHPFAYRTHTHELGKVVSGYRIRDGKWTEIGRQNPLLPQMFYNATTPNLDVKKGDILAARCTLKNDLKNDVKIGSTKNDEMCYFYIMYYVDGKDIMSSDYCLTSGPDTWYWKDFERVGAMNLADKPKTISTVPGTNNTYQTKTKLA